MIRRAAAAMVMMTAIAGSAAAASAQPAAERTPKPQEPVGAVPYRAEAVTVEVAADDAGDAAHTLAGTLTLPDAAEFGQGPYPGVVLVSGSGPQDRDSTLMGHKPFLVLADRMTRAGIAVLRYDDRGVGESTGDFAEGTIARFVRDAAAAAGTLREHPLIDADRVGLMGHSEGGAVAPMVAAAEPRTAFVVILAGMGATGAEILLFQSDMAYRKGGQDEAWIAENTRVRRAVFDAVASDADDGTVLARVRDMVEQEMTHIQKPENRERAAGMLAEQFTSPWLREFIGLDPAEALRLVAAPVLALNGTLDMQVDADQNLAPIERALAEGVCPSATVVRLVGLNHLFQPATTGMLGEYGVIETTFDEATMGLIAGWIVRVVGGEEEDPE